MVARSDEVVDGMNDGESGTHVRFKKILHPLLARQELEPLIMVVGRRGRNLVGRHDVHVAVQQPLILCRHLGRCRAVHEDGIENIHLFDFAHHPFHAAFAPLLHALPEACGVQSVAVVSRMASSADAHDVQLQAPFLQQLLALRGNLLQQAAAHSPRAADKEVEVLMLTQEKTVMQHVQRFAELAAFHHEREVHFLSAHGHSRDTDTVASQHAEKLSGNARQVAHPFADHRHAGLVLLQRSRVHRAVGNFQCEFLVEQPAGAPRVGRRHADRCARFGRVLGHHEHADAPRGQSREYAAVHTDHAHHRRTAHGHHAHLADGRNTPDGAFARRGMAADDAALAFGVERVLHIDGNVLLANGVNGGRIYHLRAKVAQLHRLGVGQLVNGIGCRDDARVCRHEAVHIRPYLQCLGVEGCRQDGSGIVRTAASEVGRDARCGIRRDKSAGHGHGRA